MASSVHLRAARLIHRMLGKPSKDTDYSMGFYRALTKLCEAGKLVEVGMYDGTHHVKTAVRSNSIPKG